MLPVGRTLWLGEMLVARWAIAGLLIAFSLFVAFGQWYCMFAIPRKKNQYGEQRNYSVVLLLGGLVGTVGCFVAPSATIQGLWWVPLLLDPGCGLAFVTLAILGIHYVYRRFVGPPTQHRR